MTIDDLAKLNLQTDVWKITNPSGYQRLPSTARVNEFSNFIKSGIGTCPLSVLVSIRKKITSTKTGKSIELEIPEGLELWVVDGQHRISGLQKLIGQSELRNFTIPMIIIPSWETATPAVNVQ